jgi:AraC-like DNA-binding protein
MHYQEIIPIKPLQEYVQFFWVLEDFTDNKSNKNFKTIPDGIPALIFQEEPNSFFDNKGQHFPQLFLYGQSTKYQEHGVLGNFKIVGAYLQPIALKTIFNLDAFELSNQNISFENIVAEPLLEQLVNTISVKEKIKAISHLFLKQIQKAKRNDKKAEFATMLLQNGKTVKDIQMEMNLSERSLERLLKQYVGMSPKMFSRIIRFQSGLDSLRQMNFTNLTELSYQNEYFDQSHYIREFREFTGTNPKNFIRNASEELVNFPQWNI